MSVNALKFNFIPSIPNAIYDVDYRYNNHHFALQRASYVKDSSTVL